MEEREEQWKSSEKEGGPVAEHGKDRRNNGRAGRRRKVEQWESMGKVGGTVAEQRWMVEQRQGVQNIGEQYEVGLIVRRKVEQWQSTEEVGERVQKE